MTKKNKELWTIRLFCRKAQTEKLEPLFEDMALAVTTLAPPRTDKAQIDILVDKKPSRNVVEALLGAESVAFEILPVGDLDWIKKVAQDFPPLALGRWTVFGAAYKNKIKDRKLALQIDATSAFGTGEHPTTKGCLILLDELLTVCPEMKKGNMLDMGCGSGILAMAFAKATRGKALGIDMDAPSVDIARRNAGINGVAARARFEKGLGYAPRAVRENAPYDLVMANIFADPLCEMAGSLEKNLKPGGYAILSGILNAQAKAVIDAHRATGLVLEKRIRLGEWSALALYKPVGASCRHDRKLSPPRRTPQGTSRKS